MFKKRQDSLFVCKSCGEGVSVKNLERHVQESHFWNTKFDYYRK